MDEPIRLSDEERAWRDRWIADVLRRYPPIQRMEELYGPEDGAGDPEDVDAFLESRAAMGRAERTLAELD